MNQNLKKCIIIMLVICCAGSIALLGGQSFSKGNALAEQIGVPSSGKLDYSDGSFYEGELLDGEIRNGVGSYSWITGESYEGTWVEDVPSGKGKMIWPGLGYYEGEFNDGKRHGHGVFTWTYEGEPETGRPLSYEGEWEKDRIGTSGTLTFANLGVYEGAFEKGVRSGVGSFTWENGDQYYGEWKNDKINGNGILTLSDKTMLEGKFTNNVFFQGTATYIIEGGVATRDVLSGKLKETVSIAYNDGTIVSGKLKGEEFVGNATINYASGDVYVGTMSKGLKSGKGTYTWASGAHYIGEWDGDKMSGKGKYYFGKDEDKLFLNGTFKNGVPLGTLLYVSEKKLKYDTVWKDGQCVSITYRKQ